MKLIAVDNLDRPDVPQTLVLEGVSANTANRVMDILHNEYLANGKALMVVENDYKLTTADDIARDLYGFEDNKSMEAELKLNPMGTAPKDGSAILLFCPNDYPQFGMDVEVCRWIREDEGSYWIDKGGDDFIFDGKPPVGWKPLPIYDQE